MVKYFTFYFETDQHDRFPVTAASEEQARNICDQLGIVALWVNDIEEIARG